MLEVYYQTIIPVNADLYGVINTYQYNIVNEPTSAMQQFKLLPYNNGIVTYVDSTMIMDPYYYAVVAAAMLGDYPDIARFALANRNISICAAYRHSIINTIFSHTRTNMFKILLENIRIESDDIYIYETQTDNIDVLLEMILAIYKYNRDAAIKLLCEAVLHYGPDVVDSAIKEYPSMPLINICIQAARKQQIDRNVNGRYTLMKIIAKYQDMSMIDAAKCLMSIIGPQPNNTYS